MSFTNVRQIPTPEEMMEMVPLSENLKKVKKIL